MTALAAVLAALGAVGYAVGARLQHRGVRATAGAARFALREQLHLLQDRTWLTGLCVLACGVTLHMSALGLAPLSVVQPLGVLALPITVVLNLRQQGTGVGQLGKPMLASIGAAMLGVCCFVVFAAQSASNTAIGGHEQLVATELVAVAVVALGISGMMSRTRLRCVLFASGSAVAYGYVSLLMRAVIQQLSTFDLTQINFTALFGVVAAMLTGSWLLQHAYASGPPDLIVAFLTVIDPIVAVGLGIGLLGEADQVALPTMLGQAACALVACAGVFALARYHPEAQRRRAGPEPVTVGAPAQPGSTERSRRNIP